MYLDLFPDPGRALKYGFSHSPVKLFLPRICKMRKTPSRPTLQQYLNYCSRECDTLLSPGDTGVIFSFQDLIRLLSSFAVASCVLGNTVPRAADQLSLLFLPADKWLTSPPEEQLHYFQFKLKCNFGTICFSKLAH